jgi:transcription elongation factor Elf1
MTAKQKKAYLKCSHKCLYCESDNITAGNVEVDDGVAIQRVICNNCYKSWNDIYRLVNVEEII